MRTSGRLGVRQKRKVKEMKKEYTTPEVEKLEFNYAETVVASDICAAGVQLYTDEGYDCHSKPDGFDYTSEL